MQPSETHTLKRKRFRREASGEDEAESSAQAIARGHVDKEDGGEVVLENDMGGSDAQEDDQPTETSGVDPPRKQRKPLPLLKKPRKNAPTPGIVYISRLPPGMTPQKVKHLMGQWGEIGKVYAQRPEHSDLASTSSKSTPSKKSKHQQANFTEAWVEFLDKKYAKVAAEALNAGVIGGKKGDKWRDDVWTMRYLSGFKWEMLGEQVAHERQAHSSRLRQELSKSRLEQSEYLRNVELARVLDKRRAKKAEAEGVASSAAVSAVGKASGGKKGDEKGQRGYRQREVAGLPGTEGRKSGSGGKTDAAKRGTGSSAGGGDVMAGVLAGLF